MILLKDYLFSRFKKRVYKITLDCGFTCPNRDGTRGEGGCLYCSPSGSGNDMFRKQIPVEEQISRSREFLQKRYKAEKFYLYFQAFSNTYAPAEKLKEIYARAIASGGDDIVGIMIGTRPDCIDREKLKLIASFAPRYEVWVEYGLQSMHPKTLKLINRGHSADDFRKAVEMTAEYPLKITAHIILGLPSETREQMRQTARFLTETPGIHALKIHSLYIPRGSGLELLFKENKIKLLSADEYVAAAVDVIEMMPEQMIAARLTGETDRRHLVAPEWVLDKQDIIDKVNIEMLKRGLKWHKMG